MNRPSSLERSNDAPRTLERALEASEAVRDDLREALRELKARHEALTLVHAGCVGRRVIVAGAEAAREVNAARATASAERERRIRAEARAEAAEAALARTTDGDRGAGTSETVARGVGRWDASEHLGGVGGRDARSEEAKALAAATRELELLRRTCDRQKRELAQARERLKTLEAALGDKAVAAATAEKTVAVEKHPASRRPGRAAPPSVAVAPTAAPLEPTGASTARADAAESCPPPLPSIDEAWTAKPPDRLPPLGGAPALRRPARSRAASSPAAPTSRPKPPRSRVIDKIAKQVAKTSRAFRAPM